MSKDSRKTLINLGIESSDLPGCEGKVIGTNVPQAGLVSTGDTLIFIIENSQEDQ